MKQVIICDDCGGIGYAKKKGSIILGLLLMFLFIAPGLLYLAFACGFVCVKCGSKRLYGVDSKAGKKSVDKHRKLKQTYKELGV